MVGPPGHRAFHSEQTSTPVVRAFTIFFTILKSVRFHILQSDVLRTMDKNKAEEDRESRAPWLWDLQTKTPAKHEVSRREGPWDANQ